MQQFTNIHFHKPSNNKNNWQESKTQNKESHVPLYCKSIKVYYCIVINSFDRRAKPIQI